MSVPPPDPVFIHFGFSGGVSCVQMVDVMNARLVLVGTGGGVASLIDPRTHKETRRVYEDSEGRAIVAGGRVGEEEVWLHVRTLGVVRVRLQVGEETLHNTGHYGFCPAAQDADTGHIVLPDCEVAAKDRHMLRWVGGERARVQLSSTPMCVGVEGGRVAVASEDGTVSVHDREGRVDTIKLCSEPLFCLALTPSLIFAGSAKPPLRVVRWGGEGAGEGGGMVEETGIQYPQESQGCSQLCLSPSRKTLLAGFWDGSMRAYSVKRRTIVLFVHLHSQPVQCLVWKSIHLEKEEEGKEELVFCGSRDERLSVWRLR